ncbi:hypothetical protein KXS07_25545 [Inquilinus limosus]|uniref:hypothetical protein n=1 Tax=Inquilinus limosus TaxID=171674 RepID=UPI003F14BD6C
MSADNYASGEVIIREGIIFPNLGEITDTVEHQTPDGFIIRASRDGKVVRYSALDAGGASLPASYLSLSDGDPKASFRTKCFFCVMDQGHYYCTEVLCPDPPQ